MLSTLRTFIDHLKNGAPAQHLRCIKHNHIGSHPFRMHYRRGLFHIDCRHGTLRFHENPFNDLALEGPGYFQHYTVSPGDVIVDAGAYVGALTVWMAVQTGEEGRVIAFEPDPWSAECLRANVALNGLRHVHVVEKALSDHEGSASWKGGGRPDARMVDSDGVTSGTTEVNVAVTTLDTELARMGIGRIDFLKMDVEGEELAALRGAQRTLSQPGTRVAVATYHTCPDGITAPLVEEFLQGMGYLTETGFPNHLTTFGTATDSGTNPPVS